MPPKAKPIADRFWKHVEVTDTCWLWRGKLKENGYGTIGTRKGSSNTYAHRMSWYLHRGDIPPSLEVCHHCDVKNCVNPDHLFIGTQSDNMRDCVNKGRHVSGLPKQPSGEEAYMAKLTLDQVREIRILRESGMSGMKIAEMFPVCYQQIYRICSGERWATDK